jgi:hypothetical protein
MKTPRENMCALQHCKTSVTQNNVGKNFKGFFFWGLGNMGTLRKC